MNLPSQSAVAASVPRVSWGREVLASMVVFLVALPLSMGIAIASGVPVSAGLITGIIGGLVTGVLAGAPLQVSGPAAGLTVIILELVREHGLAVLGPCVMVAGAVQFLAGLLKTGRWFRSISPSVIHGMLAGIGVLIFASQCYVLVDGKAKGKGWENLLHLPEVVRLLFSPAGLIGLLTIGTILLWDRFLKRRLPLVPSALVAVTLASAATHFTGISIHMVEVPASLLADIRLPLSDVISQNLQTILVSGVVIAVVASAESLLSAAAVEKMVDGFSTNYDRELIAQGTGNLLCGLAGALPMTGVIVRSSANVSAGGRTRWSAVMHGGWLLLVVMLLPGVLRSIPTASLAGILVHTGARLMSPGALVKLYRLDRMEAIIWLATTVTIVATDLLMGVITGIVLSGICLLRSFQKRRVPLSGLTTSVATAPDSSDMKLSLAGAATFISLPVLTDQLELIPRGTHVIVAAEQLRLVDYSCHELLTTWAARHVAGGDRLQIDWSHIERATTQSD